MESREPVDERLADRWQREQRTTLWKDVLEFEEEVGDGEPSELRLGEIGLIDGRFGEAWAALV